ncbi:RND transporter [Burkholderia gladioli]|uniref:efflux transporter outer membrane subunit n=1 Tax=Burkholderia gladioli TaxID=28095 RepID=UPI001364E1C0|nr:efflux transporter outer membrane subunit [Burkholderia gladioli]KAF1061910.1 Antibiotic efflux pump outer membrane protein ArpC [Burkholderia gladioli]WAG18263.1 RND transporter [Burkholderia gladioli]
MSTLPHDKQRVRPRLPGRLGRAPAIAALLAGCTVGPDFVAPSPPQVSRYLPPTAEAANAPAWRGDGRTQFLSEAKPMRRDWWSGFASREIDSAVADALTGSPTLEGAQATLRRSQHALLAGQGIFFPQADAQAGASRQRYAPLQTGQPLPATIFNLFTLTAAVSYTFDLWGGQRRLVEALAADVDARRAALAAAYLMLSANVVNTMIARAAYHDAAATTRDMLALLDEQIRLTRIQATAGVTTEGAVVALQSQRASLAATLPAIDLGHGQADDLLALLAGRHPAEWRAPELRLEAITLPAELPATVPSSLARRRPDIQQAEAELHIASAQVGTATAALYPELTLSASGSLDGASASRLFSPAGRAWGIGAGLSAPLFRGGTLWNQRRAAQDALALADANYRQVVLKAFSQVADSLRALAGDAQAVDARADAMTASRTTLRLAQVGLDSGVGSDLQVLAADLQYRQARLAWLQAVAQRLQDTVAFYVALGGGWTDAR